MSWRQVHKAMHFSFFTWPGTRLSFGRLHRTHRTVQERSRLQRLMSRGEPSNTAAQFSTTQHRLTLTLTAAGIFQAYSFPRCMYIQTSPNELALARLYPSITSQVEYLPAGRVVDGLAMISALIPSIDGKFVPSSNLRDPRLFGTEPLYSAKHTALQTTDLFNKVFA